MVYIVLLIIGALVVALMATRFGKKKSNDAPADEAQQADRPSDCCGAHEVCESDTLLSSSDAVEYYNDEELDRFKCRDAESYTDNEIEEFREVLLTLMEREVSGWLKSLQLRGVTPPSIVREEALMIVADRRFMNKQ